MEMTWLESETSSYDELILAGDAGGTNTTIAVVGRNGDSYRIIVKCRYRSAEIENFTETVSHALASVRKERASIDPSLFCVSAAGPVIENTCSLTNTNWTIDGNEVERVHHLRTKVVNDFYALSFGVPLLDTKDPAQIAVLKHPDGSCPPETGSTKAVLGAGTGLGVGLLRMMEGRPVAIPSEGGHSDFAPFDEETRALRDYIAQKIGTPNPSNERFISGQGVVNIFSFFRDVKKIPISGPAAEINAVPDDKKPPLISKYSRSDETCASMLRLFVRMYGRYAGNVGTFFLPTAGLYVAGGIVTKDEPFFHEDNRFMRFFEMNDQEGILGVLKTIPVYIVKNYDTSLLGAAHAGVHAFNRS